ncbi:hypothetical protein [Leptospira borgpetersenii]|nr:hypothetical protein [Leptospira borgpetersenii]MCH1890815.1 hypothetical protein [Leptospira borgpetersenii]MCH1897365.1 hypothetical protein [Leptospira borgpetersenii]UOY19896.1 hypothetical protein K8O67_14945 [Leptospira borgpetersenii]UOZ23575.1 hypothetical protein K8O65_15010 [Leptospira borgpetersenii]UOZ26536.1 hypothetical protein K8O64_15010 [Leptospira borgpetersenii]
MEMKSQSQKGDSMGIMNRNECKDFICITLETKIFSKFDKKAEVNCVHLSKSLNGHQFYAEIIKTFKKWNIIYHTIPSTHLYGKRKNRRISL